MEVSFDPAKRAWTLAERGLDFADAVTVFAGLTLNIEDTRFDYGERRNQTYGLLAERVVMVVWTPRSQGRHVISMRHCHEREARRVRQHLD